MAYIVGLNAYHGDASACILKDGKILAAAEEERFKRAKHWAGFPRESLKFCLEQANIGIDEVNTITINSNPRVNLLKKMIFVLKHKPKLGNILNRIENTRSRLSLRNEILKSFPEKSFLGKIIRIEHHLSHLSSAYYPSPFNSASVVSVDGFGDFSSGCWGVGEGSEIKVHGRVLFPHSLGIFYQAMTQFLGFPNYGDEYKVMGLAPYGKPIYMNQMREILKLQNDGSYKLNLKYFIFHKEKFSYEWNNVSPVFEKLFSNKMHELFGSPRKNSDDLSRFHMDLASSVQAMYEEAFFHLLNKIYENQKNVNLCLAGGCGNNSVANGKIRQKTNFKNIYVAAAAGDAGGAIGSAYEAFFMKDRSRERSKMTHAYLGPNFSNDYILKLLNSKKEVMSSKNIKIFKTSSFVELSDLTVDSIIEGKVIGWFQGSMEWGPRALGNRSILADPRRKDMKEILNSKIKRRESFRPFAPSILREKVSEWFEDDDEVPFMMKVLKFKKGKQNQIPAVCHVDGSGRLQTVYKDTNERYYKLIRNFELKTGIPILLNTSFNENEPVVCKPEEALDCFLRTKMDVLVLNDYYISRKNT